MHNFLLTSWECCFATVKINKTLQAGKSESIILIRSKNFNLNFGMFQLPKIDLYGQPQ